MEYSNIRSKNKAHTPGFACLSIGRSQICREDQRSAHSDEANLIQGEPTVSGSPLPTSIVDKEV
jgi:hypothetical protein